jgi:hypothetical protein
MSLLGLTNALAPFADAEILPIVVSGPRDAAAPRRSAVLVAQALDAGACVGRVANLTSRAGSAIAGRIAVGAVGRPAFAFRVLLTRVALVCCGAVRPRLFMRRRVLFVVRGAIAVIAALDTARLEVERRCAATRIFGLARQPRVRLRVGPGVRRARVRVRQENQLEKLLERQVATCGHRQERYAPGSRSHFVYPGRLSRNRPISEFTRSGAS